MTDLKEINKQITKLKVEKEKALALKKAKTELRELKYGKYLNIGRKIGSAEWKAINYLKRKSEEKKAKQLKVQSKKAKVKRIKVIPATGYQPPNIDSALRNAFGSW